MSPSRHVWILLPLLTACYTTVEEPESALDKGRERMKAEAYSADASRQQTTIGLELAQLDLAIQKWNAMFLAGSQAKNRHQLTGLHDHIRNSTVKLFSEIVAELETGPLINRRVAATALGFVQAEESLSPLLNALTDPDEQVTANALLGLAMLGDPNTPVADLSHFLQFGASPAIRSNAALAALEVLRSGGEGGESIAKAARSALNDNDPGVRTQSAMILAHQVDTASIDELSMQLVEDPIPSAQMAAARALAYIGSKNVRQKGRVARSLTAALSRVEGNVRSSLLIDLTKLAGRNYSKDEDWVTWAHRLPLEPL